METALDRLAPHGSDEDITYRTPPHNLEAEQALLGAILINNEAYDRVAAFLDASHFYEPLHGRIFETATKLITQGHLASPVTLKHYFEQDEAIKEIGGTQYPARLVLLEIVLQRDGADQ